MRVSAAVHLMGVLAAMEPVLAEADDYYYCERPDSDACVPCIGKDECSLGQASVFKRSRVGVFNIAGQTVDFRYADNDFVISLDHPRPTEYAVWIMTTLGTDDTDIVCGIVVSSLERTADPATAKTVLYETKVRYGTKGSIKPLRIESVSEVPYVDGYVAIESVVFDGEEQGYRLMRDIVYKNLVLEQVCLFEAKPRMDDPRFLQIGFTVTADDKDGGLAPINRP